LAGEKSYPRSPEDGISVSLQQAAENSNLKSSSWGNNQIDLVILLKSFYKRLKANNLKNV
jgi:hypothetical protein